MSGSHSHSLWRYLLWLPWALALAGLAYLAGLTAWLAIRGLFYPFQLDYGEGLLLHFVNEWAAGRPIYGPLGTYPFVTANYPPVSMVLSLALTPVLGVGYAAGRIWTLLAVVAGAGLIVAWVRREGRQWLPAVAAALLFVGSPYVYHWAPLFRADLVGLAFTLGGLYAINLMSPPRAGDRSHVGMLPPQDGESEEAQPRSWLLWLAVVLFVAGLYAKQSFVFAPAAAAAYLFLFGDRRQALKLVGGMVVLGGGLFLVINTLTGGGFWQGLVESNVNPFLWTEFVRQMGDFFGTFAILVFLAAWYVVDKYLLDGEIGAKDKISPLDLYLVAALLSLVLAGKAGAWENYFFEALATVILCAGLGLARLRGYGRWAFCLLAPLLLVVQVGLMWHTPQVANRYLALTSESNKAIEPLLAQADGPVFSEDMGLLVTNDKVMDYCSFQYSQLARAGRWDQSWELGQLIGHQRAAIVLEEGTRLDVDRYQRFTREFLSELDHNYERTQTLGKYHYYEAAPLQHEKRAEFDDDLALVGWSLAAPPRVEPGDGFSLTVVWQAQQALDNDYTAFAHLVDEQGQGWAGTDQAPYEGLYPTSAWGAGEMVRDTFALTVPENAPLGLYDLQVGWYDPATQDRLPTAGGDSVRVAVLPVGWDGAGSGEPVEHRFGEAISLESASWELAPGGAPDTVRVRLGWSTREFMDRDYTVFVHLLAAGGEEQALAQGDAPPLDGRWPTSLWLPDVGVDDEHSVPLPADLPPGRYEIVVGVYDPATGVRLLLADGSDAVRVGEFELP